MPLGLKISGTIMVGHTGIRAKAISFNHGRLLLERLCALAGSLTFTEDARASLERAGAIGAVRDHDDGVLFDWVMQVVSYQGIADEIATSYMDRHGRIRAADVHSALAARPTCLEQSLAHPSHGCPIGPALPIVPGRKAGRVAGSKGRSIRIA